MPKILNVNKTSDYSVHHGLTDRHPLVTVIDFSEISPIRHSLNKYSVYGVFVQDDNDLDLTYGCGKYDYKDGSLICVAPGQVGGKEDNGESPGRHIRQFVIRQIKNELASGLRVAEVAYKLGFEYPAHLSRMFKKETGQTPTEYIQSRKE